MAEHLLLSHNFSSPIAGRLVKKNGSVGPEYHVNDYLCSVRVVTDYMGRVLERNDYSGFGKRLDSSTGSSNRYRFSGKEEQSQTVPGWQDFGARMYDPDLARWTTPDPLADQYPGISPYAYCADDPVNFVDPEGEAWGKVLKIGKKIYKTAKVGKKIDVKDILEGEILDYIDNVNTLLDTDASSFEKSIAAFDLATGFGDEAKWVARTVGVSDAIVDGAKTSSKKSKLQEAAEIGQEAHRQIEKELKISVPGTEAEVRMRVGKQNVRKDAVMPDGTVVIIKPDTPSGHKAAVKRGKMMKDNGYKTQNIFYDPTDSRWLPDSPTYIGPKR